MALPSASRIDFADMTAKELMRKSEQQETTQLVDESKRECRQEQRKSKDEKSEAREEGEARGGKW